MVRRYLMTVLSLISLLTLTSAPVVFTPIHAAARQAAQAEPVPIYSVNWTVTAHGSSDVTNEWGRRFVQERTITINGSATVLMNPDGTKISKPATLTTNDLLARTETYPCPYPPGGVDLSKSREYIITPNRYTGDSNLINIWSPQQRPDGSWFMLEPGFAGTNGGGLFTYRYEREDINCDGKVYDYSSTREDSPWPDVASPGNLEGDSTGKTFTKKIQLQNQYTDPTLTIDWSVTVRVLEGRDLTVNQLEVTQGLQDGANSIPLVRGRRTVVRATIGIGSEPGFVSGVTGKLTAYRGDVELGSVEPFNPGGRISASSAPDWRQIDDTLNFELQYEWTLEPELVLKVEVNHDRSVPERNVLNNEMEVFMTTQECAPLTIEYHPIHYAPPNQPPSDPGANINLGEEFLRKIYPVGDNDLNYVGGFPMEFKRDINVGGNNTRLNNMLGQSLLWRVVRPDHTYGWLAANTYNKNGYGEKPGTAAFGNDTEDPNRWRRTFAHEIGHNYFLEHSDLTTSGYHWFDVYDRFIKPVPPDVGGSDLLDMMVPARLEPEAWISPVNYENLFNARCWTAGAGRETAGVAQPRVPAVTDTIMVTGIVISGTTPAGDLDPIYHSSSVPVDVPPAPQTVPGYCVGLKSGSTLLSQHCFNLDFNVDSTMPASAMSFGMVLTSPVGLDHVELTRGRSGAVLSSRIASAHPPTVTVTFPNTATLTLTSTETIRWTGSDLDGDSLTYEVFYSLDDGGTWNLVSVGITGTEYALDFANMPGTDRGRIKVEASDGFLSAADASDNPFAVPNKPPTAIIISPPTGVRRNAGEEIILQGAGLDPENDAMPDGALSWSSDKDGALGTGRLLETTLSVGSHQITLTVMDTGGLSDIATIHVDVLSKSSPPSWVYLPLVMASVGGESAPAATATPAPPVGPTATPTPTATVGTPHPLLPGLGPRRFPTTMTATPAAP